MSAEGDKGKKRGPAPKQRGHPRDSPEVRFSKSLSWLLRHGAESAGLHIRQDGYAKVSDVLSNPMFRDATFAKLQDIVTRDQKSRYHLLMEPQTSESIGTDVWWIRANQGHSMKDIKLELQPITSASDIPMAVHGTSRKAWKLIATEGLSKMTRNHIHLAQDVPGNNVISGMRNSSQILIFVDVQKAIDAGIRFYLSTNGVVLTEGNVGGFLLPTFFQRVEDANRNPVGGWEGRRRGYINDPIGGIEAWQGHRWAMSS
ncbi:KptA family-domain-containing protein [Melanogaster broomeanus]|nr:KptA family-domain-containing protein [Melanogaster broomeanus]